MNVRSLSNKLQEKAIVELNEDPQKIQEAFDRINEWLQKQPHLIVRKDDQTMIAFFRGCKWNLQRVKEKLDYFYSIKTSLPDLFRKRDPLSLDIQKVLNAGIVFPLPYGDDYCGPVILLYNLANVDVNETPYIVTVKLFFMSLDILMREDDNFVVSGIILIADHDKCPVNYYLQCTPKILTYQAKCFQDAYPIRIKNIISVNTLTLFQVIFNTILKPIANAKIQQRLHVPNSQQAKRLLSEIPQNVLPEEYGGTNGTLKDAADKWKEKVESYREWFLEDPKYGTNENLRRNKIVFENGVGLDGSFRNLSID